MTSETLDRIIEIAHEPRALNLSGLGEPTLHKRLVPFVNRLHRAGFKVQVNTNGRRLDQGLYNQLYISGCHNIVITADYFKWDKGKINTNTECPIQLLTLTREPDHPELGQHRKELDDWAGRVGKVNRQKVPCSFINPGFVQITWDGRIQRCCADFNVEHGLGSIFNDADVEAARANQQGIPLCNSCHGFVFESGIVAGNFSGQEEKPPEAFVDLKLK